VIRFTFFAVFTYLAMAYCIVGRAATVTFFDPEQVATLVAEGTTSDQIRSTGYYFTYTRDKLFTGGGPEPIGRYVRIPWPQGVEAQAVTSGPNPGKAKITIERVDGSVFDFTAFTAKLLANTAGAGGTFEVVPFLNGEEVLPNPITFDATGYYGSTFSYNQSPNPWGSTAPLTGYDKYSIDLYVDFALIGLTFDGPPVPMPPGDFNQNYVVDAADYVVWRNADGSAAEYEQWRTNFGAAAGSGALSNYLVPEPPVTILELVLIGSLRRSKQIRDRWVNQATRRRMLVRKNRRLPSQLT
jgi:hypothetical protein